MPHLRSLKNEYGTFKRDTIVRMQRERKTQTEIYRFNKHFFIANIALIIFTNELQH